MKVMIIDDSHLVLNGLRKLIPWEALGISLIGEAINGDEGYKKIIELQPDVVITDVKMPVMSGIDMCERIYKSPLQPEIIILSAYDDFNYAKNAMKFGVKDYILKPINRDKVDELIANLKRLKKDYERKNSLINSVLTEDIEEMLYQALAAQDFCIVEDFFNHTIKERYTTKEEANQLVLRITNSIYSYFQNIGINIDSILSSKVKTLDRLLGIKDTEQMLYELRMLFSQVIQFSEHNTEHEEIIQHAIRIIHEKFVEAELSVGDIAEQLYITPTYLSILFKKYKQINISNYITQLRLETAIEMLKSPNYKVIDVSRKVGYKDPKYFSKVFKKQTGYTPSNYRKHILKLHMYKQ
ncbi:response regulator transcription factor [Vallitalea okinawensis]|uniref:response regulator transcription factor n=1 Tax=Vallitalea okinawensis TaxID=2078660 RepID=UPI0014783230|nr:response regulator [Vallitalea okinawensis]